MIMGIFREWVQNIVVFLLLMTMAGQLIPDEKYKKYIRLTMGLLLIMVILIPIGRLTGLDKQVYENYIQENLNMAAADAQAGNIIFDEDTLFIGSYRQTVAKEVEAYFKEESMIMKYCELEMDENSSSNTYGQIHAMRIGVISRDKNGGSEETAAVSEDIYIADVVIGGKREEKAAVSYVPEEKQEEWVENLSLQFGVDREQIELEILS